jgi:hypothetical protein
MQYVTDGKTTYSAKNDMEGKLLDVETPDPFMCYTPV